MSQHCVRISVNVLFENSVKTRNMQQKRWKIRKLIVLFQSKIDFKLTKFLVLM